METVLFDIQAYADVGDPRHRTGSLIDTAVKVELTPGLAYSRVVEVTRTQPKGTGTETVAETNTSYAHDSTGNTGEWDIGFLAADVDGHRRQYLTLTLEAALDADFSESEQCLTATITALPLETPDDQTAALTEDNIARACVDVQQPGSAGADRPLRWGGFAFHLV